MATSFTFNTLQRGQLFPFPFCKSFASPLHNSLSSFHSFSFPSPKHALTSKLSSTFLANNNTPVISFHSSSSSDSAVFTGLNCGNSAETLDYRDNCGNSGGVYLLSGSNGHKDRCVEEKVDRGVVDDGKRRKNGARTNLGGIIEKDNECFSSNDDRIERRVEGSVVFGVEGNHGHGGGEFGYGSNGRGEFGKGNSKGKKVSLSKTSGDRGWRRVEEIMGDMGLENDRYNRREFGVGNNDNSGGRGNLGNGIDKGKKVSLSNLSVGRGRGRMEEVLGDMGFETDRYSKREFGYENNENSDGRGNLGNGIEKGKKVSLSKLGSGRGRRREGEVLGDVGIEEVRNSRSEFGYDGNSGGRIALGKRNGDGSKTSSMKLSGDRETRAMVEVLSSVGENRREFQLKNGGQKGNCSSSIWIRDSKSGNDSVSGKLQGQTIKESNTKNGSKVAKKKRSSKKPKVELPEFQLRVGLDMCSKKGDVVGAISLYDSALKQGIKMGQHQYTVLLYLCSSAAMGVIRPAKSGSSSRSLHKVASDDLDESVNSKEEDDDTDNEDDEDLGVKTQTEKPEVNEIRVSDDVKKYALERGFEVYERMCLDNVQMNEASLTSVARMAMAMGNGDMAFDTVKQTISMGLSPRLRSYGPALSVFCSSGELEKAFAVEQHMLENNIYPEEPELEALLKVSVHTGKADRVYYVLQKLRTNVRSVSPSTAELVEKWFKSKEASRVGKRKWDEDAITQTMEKGGGGWHGQGWLGTGKWSVSRTSIGAEGLCQCCGEKLALIDLDPEETEKFAESVASIAIKRDKNSCFQKFQRWLDYYGPFEAVVDAANVGLYSQRKFKASKVNVVVNGIRQMLPSRNWPLIILHNKRVNTIMTEQPMNRAFVEKWRNADALYPTPTGSNDDWYWLYAAIKFKCLLVTNDEMRDHTFQLLGNDFFPKWKERHQVRFSFTEIGPVFHMPPPCSVVIQESCKGSWHIPIASDQQSEGDRTWLCITRPRVLVRQQGPKVIADPGEGSIAAVQMI